MFENVLNKKCIVRGDKSGVFYATVENVEDKTVATMSDARFIYYWEGANTIADLSIQGSKRPQNCKITAPVRHIVITDAAEFIPCTEEAIANLDSIREWVYNK